MWVLLQWPPRIAALMRPDRQGGVVVGVADVRIPSSTLSGPPGEERLKDVTLYELLPSLSGASRPRFDSAMWPVATQYHLGRLTFDGMAAEDIADCMGTPTVFDGVLVTRVRSVIAGIVRIDGTIDDVADAEIASRHSVAGREFFAIGDTKIELPSDVRAGDVLALVLKT